MRIALATCEEPPVPDEDARLLGPALAELGVEVEEPVWSDLGVDWSAFDLVQLSSTWDYHQRLPEFREWLDRVEAATRLENPRELVEWNLDKRYLAELSEAGVRIVPTVWAEPGEESEAAEQARQRGWDPVVVKPVVDLGAERLQKVAPGEVETALKEIGEPCLVQPFLESLGRSGELSLVFLRGELSHSILKTPAKGDFRIHEHFGGTWRAVEAPTSAVAAAEEVLSLLAAGDIGPAGLPGTPPLYGRVDLVGGPDGEPCVIELELIEPNLYLHVAGPEATARFAAHLVG